MPSAPGPAAPSAPVSSRPSAGARDDDRDTPLLNVAVKRLGTEWSIAVSNFPAVKAIAARLKRRAIECMFADAKTRGLDLEDTRRVYPRKLALLMALAAPAIAL